jgi:hypothetical protein
MKLWPARLCSLLVGVLVYGAALGIVLTVMHEPFAPAEERGALNFPAEVFELALQFPFCQAAAFILASAVAMVLFCRLRPRRSSLGRDDGPS